MHTSGILSCLRYCLPPNSLSYCGPDKTADLIGYRQTEIIDNGLIEAVKEFSTLYGYLCLIAGSNNIRNPFDARVVEAYWIGNNLLCGVRLNDLYRHFTDTMKIGTLVKRADRDNLLDKLDDGLLPCHASHVFNLMRRTGHIPIEHTTLTMDACRIGWGQVEDDGHLNMSSVTVLSQPLILTNGKLNLGKKKKKIIANIIGKNFPLIQPKNNDWVSFHWNILCDILKPHQVSALQLFTMNAIRLANKTL